MLTVLSMILVSSFLERTQDKNDMARSISGNHPVRWDYYQAIVYGYWHVRWLRFWTELGHAYAADRHRNRHWRHDGC